jgi:hypothetical protein
MDDTAWHRQNLANYLQSLNSYPMDRIIKLTDVKHQNTITVPARILLEACHIELARRGGCPEPEKRLIARALETAEQFFKIAQFCSATQPFGHCFCPVRDTGIVQCLQASWVQSMHPHASGSACIGQFS